MSDIVCVCGVFVCSQSSVHLRFLDKIYSTVRAIIPCYQLSGFTIVCHYSCKLRRCVE